MSIRSQIYDLLAADTTLTGMLAGGAQGIMNETDFTAQSPVPCLVIHYLGPSPHMNVPELDAQNWEFKVFDRDQAYFNIENILERVRFVLHRKVLGRNAAGTSAGLEIMYAWQSRAWFDAAFRADTESMVFLVPLLHTT